MGHACPMCLNRKSTSAKIMAAIDGFVCDESRNRICSRLGGLYTSSAEKAGHVIFIQGSGKQRTGLLSFHSMRVQVLGTCTVKPVPLLGEDVGKEGPAS